MKRHPFLVVDMSSSVKLSRAERKIFVDLMTLTSKVLDTLFEKVDILKSSKTVNSIYVSLLICGDARIKKLNFQHRRKNKVTDVLSFPAFDDLRKLVKLPLDQEGTLGLGDMAICLPQLKRQAIAFDISTGDEFVHLFVHGILHLMGFDHEVSPKEELLMQKYEEIILNEISKRKRAKKRGFSPFFNIEQLC